MEDIVFDLSTLCVYESVSPALRSQKIQIDNKHSHIMAAFVCFLNIS